MRPLQGSARLFIGNNECIKDTYDSTDTLFVCYTPPAPGGWVGSTQRVAMYLTGASQGYASAQCDYSTCQFYYYSQYTPIPYGYTSLGGSGGSYNHLYRAYGLIYGATADVTANSNYNIKLGGYACVTDPSRQTYYPGTTDVVNWAGTGIVKWCVGGASSSNGLSGRVLQCGGVSLLWHVLVQHGCRLAPCWPRQCVVQSRRPHQRLRAGICSAQVVAGMRALVDTERWDGPGALKEGTMHACYPLLAQVTLDGVGTVFQYTAHPTIRYLSYSTTGLNGGSELTITGTNFGSDPEDNKVRYV